jgi:hypothetical protein
MVPAALGAGARTAGFIHHSLLADEHDVPFPPGATRRGEERAAAGR